MGYSVCIPLRQRIPTVLVRLVTDEGEVVFRARWRRPALDLQRTILFRLRRGQPLWFETDHGRDLCFRAERVHGALVYGRARKA